MGAVLRVALAVAVVALSSGAQAEHVVRLSFETKANPPRYLGEGTSIDPQRPGLTIELLRLVEPRVGVRFEFRLQMELGPRVRSQVEGKTVVRVLENYSSQWAQC